MPMLLLIRLALLATLGLAERVQPEQDHLLLQRAATTVLTKSAALSRVRHTGFVANPALDFYRHWSSGLIQHRLERTLESEALLRETAPTSAERGLELLAQQRREECPHAPAVPQMKLHDSAIDKEGVQHFLYQRGSQVQYVALAGDSLLHADPAPCAKALLQAAPIPELVPMEERGAGEEESLNPYEDKLVLECETLFHRTVRENCGGLDLDIVFKTATLQVVEGIQVTADVLISKRHNKSGLPQWKYHEIMCDFEVPSDHRDASLLQLHSGLLPTETKGLVGVLEMTTALCDSWKVDSVTDSRKSTIALLETQALGELSRYKGYEYLLEALPRAAEPPSLVQEPVSTDFRTRFEACFPDSGKEVMRDQGQCGSCWAFASASTIMSQLCVSGSSAAALASPTDRLEVAVSQLLACNSENRGCNGGNAKNTDSALQAHGIAKERDAPYACGSGDAQKHFEQRSGSCRSPPWGVNCLKDEVANPDWVYGGAMIVEGEPAMRKWLAAGHALYVTIDTYENFMNHQGGVYTRPTGRKLGGHAISCVGFGTEAGKLFWLIQNSWGTRWAENGYAKVLRGKNTIGIETQGHYFRAWVKDGVVPPCQDGTTSGLLRSGGGPLPCKDVKRYCDDLKWGPYIRPNCQVTCGACKGGVGEPDKWGKGFGTETEAEPDMASFTVGDKNTICPDAGTQSVSRSDCAAWASEKKVAIKYTNKRGQADGCYVQSGKKYKVFFNKGSGSKRNMAKLAKPLCKPM